MTREESRGKFYQFTRVPDFRLVVVQPIYKSFLIKLRIPIIH